MSDEPVELMAFSNISEEMLSKIIAIMDETIVKDQLHSKKVDAIIQFGFSKEKARDIITTFFNFYMGLNHPDQVMSLIDNSSLNQKDKDLMKKAYETIKSHADVDYLEIIADAKDLQDYGHPHLHTIGVQSEFRPIVKNGKIIRMVPSIVFSGIVYDHMYERADAINFQVKLETFEEMVEELNEGLEKIKKEISALKNQLGDNIVG